ncbi:hypothetical protein [Kitasatospora phosalacinea]|uniref:hypothetical protein n=1 Tax=Kitasatospora phosalacinea TaxID=2065 RepID=UPI0012FEF0EE|nr:hypothetical protein [Kitasatospora phosalacinea]
MISDQRTGHGIPHSVSCRALGVSEAWFYKWRRRPAAPTNRELRRARLEERIRHFFHRIISEARAGCHQENLAA